MLITNLISLVNIVVLFFLLTSHKKNPLHNKILAMAFLVPGYFFFDTVLILTGMIYTCPFSFFFAETVAILFPVLLYFYVQLLLRKRLRFHPLLMSGSVLLLFYALYLSYDFYQSSAKEKIIYLNGLTQEPYPSSMMYYTIVFYAWQMVYFSVLTIEILSFIKESKTIRALIEIKKSIFLKKFILILWIFNFILIVLYLTLPMYDVDYFWLPLTVNIFYAFLIFNSYQQETLFSKVKS